MAEPEVSVADPPAQPSDEAVEHRPRGAVLRFVATFVVLVMAFLIGYRYAMNTPANIWYLFQVAKHTTWALDFLGDSADIEPLHHTSPIKWRADLAEWRAERKGDATTAEPAAPNDAPISAWESWQWKAWSRIRDGETISEDGPIVHFVLKDGLDAKQKALKQQLAETKTAAQISKDDLSGQVADIEKRLQDISKEIESHPAGPERNRVVRGEQFSFHVVPDCGAIPSMSIFLAAVLAFPAMWWKRFAGALGGIVLLYGVNVVRLSTLGYIGAIDESPGRKWFTFAHEYVWQGVFIVFVVAVWMLWVEWLVRPRRA